MRTAPVRPANDPLSSGRRTVVLTGAARGVRRRLGPTAWTVLEELVLGVADGEAMVVETHVRRIAGGVGISKDTAARALRRLIAEGIVSRRNGREPGTGCFGRSVYVLHLDEIAGVDVVGWVPAGRPDASAGRRRRQHSGGRSLGDRQGSLFDASEGAAQ